MNHLQHSNFHDASFGRYVVTSKQLLTSLLQMAKMLSIVTSWFPVLSPLFISETVKVVLNNRIIKFIQSSFVPLNKQLPMLKKVVLNFNKDWLLSLASPTATSTIREALEEFRYYLLQVEKTQFGLEQNSANLKQNLSSFSAIFDALNDRETADLIKRKYQ
jgi:hypothetical protein